MAAVELTSANDDSYGRTGRTLSAYAPTVAEYRSLYEPATVIDASAIHRPRIGAAALSDANLQNYLTLKWGSTGMESREEA